MTPREVALFQQLQSIQQGAPLLPKLDTGDGFDKVLQQWLLGSENEEESFALDSEIATDYNSAQPLQSE